MPFVIFQLLQLKSCRCVWAWLLYITIELLLKHDHTTDDRFGTLIFNSYCRLHGYAVKLAEILDYHSAVADTQQYNMLQLSARL
jgi:hypothetical protein